MENQKYIDNAGNICPNCESNNVEAESPEADGGIAWGKVECVDCSAVWVDHFRLVGYSRLELK